MLLRVGAMVVASGEDSYGVEIAVGTGFSEGVKRGGGCGFDGGIGGDGGLGHGAAGLHC